MNKTLATITALLALATYVIPPHITPWNYPADDSFFYLQVASHIADGNGSTFNNITRTNGYHPLWMPFCVLSDVLAGGDRDRALHLALGIQQILGLASAFMLYRLFKQLGIASACVVFPVLGFFSITRIYLSEAYLNLFFTSATLMAGASILSRGGQAGWKNFAGAGALAGLMILSRLDNIFTAGAILASILLFHARISGAGLFSAITIRNAGAAAACTALVVAPYLALNYFSFGHLMPISGAIKNAAGAGVGFHWDGVSPMGRLFAFLIVLGMAWSLGRRIPPAAKGIYFGLAGGYLALLGYIVFLTRHHTDWPWYYTGGAVASALAAALLADRIVAVPPFRFLTAPRLLALGLAACIGMNAYASARFLYPGLVYGEGTLEQRLGYDTRWQQEVGNWLKTNLAPDSRIITYDWPGIIAYASGQSILAPDGLMNDFDYNHDILQEGIVPYLREKNIRYWLGPASEGTTADQYWYEISHRGSGTTVEIIAPLLMKSAGAFTLAPNQLKVRFRDVLSNPETPDLALWSIQAE